MRLLISVLLITVSLLSGCVTPYQKRGFGGGYTDTRLGDNIFQISFGGNAYTNRERASDFALLRSAEVAKENGFKYFVIVESEKYSDVRSNTYTTYSTQRSSKKSDKSDSLIYQEKTYTTSFPNAVNTIACYKEMPDVDGLVFEADFVIKSIKANYELDAAANNPSKSKSVKNDE